MTTRVTCTNPDGCHILGRPVAEGASVEVDDEIASVLDPEQWKVGRAKPRSAAATDEPKTTTDEDKETGQ
jgi:hypothetical protein